MNNGYGSLYCYHQDVIYVQGTDARWYKFTNNAYWALYGDNPPVPLPAPPAVVSLPRVVADGAFFKLESGQRVTVISCTDFQLYQRYLNGEEIRHILQQRKDFGFNTLRVLGMCHNMFRLYPHEYANFYSLLKPFANLVASYGLYIEFTVFADATVAMPDVFAQRTHWSLIGSIASSLTNVSLELVNEENQPVNRLAARDSVGPIPGVLCSHGSNGSEARPVRPWWNYETFHTNQAFEWWRKVGHNAMELSDGAENLPASHVPIVANENTRPDQDMNVNHFYDAAAAAALLCAGSCFHSQGGKLSLLLEGNDAAFANAWVAGAKSVPVEFQAGRYIRLDPGVNLRVYERRLADGRGHVVTVRR
jgi:hypothetical protein